jgi:hypothetical protein
MDLKHMRLRDRVGYIWDYYKLLIIGVAVAIFLLGYFIRMFTAPKSDIAFEAAFVNCYDNVSESSDLYRGFSGYFEEGEGKIVFDNNLFFDLNKSSDYNGSYYQKLVAYLEAGTYDAVICGYDNLVGVGQGGRYIDLRDERIKSVYDTYGDRAVYIETEEGKIPIGIDISDSPFIGEMNSYGDGCYIAFCANSSHFEADVLFLEYLLGK